MTSYGLYVWIQDVFNLVGMDEFVFRNLPDHLKSIGDLRRAFKNNFLEKAGSVKMDQSSYAVVWKMTKKAERRFSND